MKMKNYRLISNLTGIMLGAFAFSDIINYPFQIRRMLEKDQGYIISQGVYVLGLICLFIFYGIILDNLKKRGVFIKRNEKAFRYFGIAILIFGMASDILYKNITEIDTASPRILALLGGTFIFISYLFTIGIKIQEEQELTI